MWIQVNQQGLKQRDLSDIHEIRTSTTTTFSACSTAPNTKLYPPICYVLVAVVCPRQAIAPAIVCSPPTPLYFNAVAWLVEVRLIFLNIKVGPQT